MMFRVATIAALVGFVSADSFSVGCMNTLMNIASNFEITQCLAPNQLLPIIVGAGAGKSHDSVVPPIDSWLNAMCASAPCSTNVIQALATNLTTGCSTEFDLTDAKTTVDFISKNYWTARKVVCLKDGQSRCTTQTLQNVEKATGTMTLNDTNVVSLAKAINKGLDASIVCSNCNKGAFSIINQDVPGTFDDSVKQAASAKCGASFIDGGIPAGLVLGDYEPVASTTSAAPVPTSTTPAPVQTTQAQPSPSIPVPGNAALRGSSMSFTGVGVSALVALILGWLWCRCHTLEFVWSQAFESSLALVSNTTIRACLESWIARAPRCHVPSLLA